jgi:SAM-dependent methyltransferase
MSDEALKIYYSRFVPGFLVNPEIWKEDLVRRPLLNNMDLDVIEEVGHKGTILDIGACAGDFLCYARARGWEPYAQELSQDCASVLRQLEIPVERGFIYETVYDSKFFDVISLRHTLEHSPRLRIELRLLHRALADDGILYIVVPMWLGVEHSKEGGHSLPQHISHFTADTLELLLILNGFEVQRIELTESSRALVDDEQKGKLQNIRCVARKV